jgi:hypothetical protein
MLATAEPDLIAVQAEQPGDLFDADLLRVRAKDVTDRTGTFVFAGSSLGFHYNILRSEFFCSESRKILQLPYCKAYGRSPFVREPQVRPSV